MKPPAIIALSLVACPPAALAGEVRVVGSDSMVELAARWAEKNAGKGISTSVTGGGSTTGFKALENGKCEIAMSTREIKAPEIAQIKTARGAAPVETVVCYEALAIVVHKNNPQKSISLAELREVFGEQGTLTEWAQLGGGFKGTIKPYGRVGNSGVASQFSDAVFGKAQAAQRAINLKSTDNMVSWVADATEAIGYVPMYSMKDEGIKALDISKDKGGDAVALTEANVRAGKYPLGKKFYFYTVGEVNEDTTKFLKFVASPAAQKVAAESGYIALAE